MLCKGVALVPGIAVGVLWTPTAGHVVDGDLAEFGRVRGQFIEQTAALPDDLGQMYQALAWDPVWDDEIAKRLALGAPLADAIAQTAAAAAQELAALDDPYLAARSADLVQLGGQFVRLLDGEGAAPPDQAIVCARDLSAVELQNWSALIGGVALIDVAPTAHLAIVARGLGLPTVALAGASAASALDTAIRDGDAPRAVLNGFQGWLETAADADVLRSNPPQRIVAAPDPEPVVAGGRRIGVFANINAPSEATLGATLGADGIGLLRTEFLYVDRTNPPTLEEESAAYRRVAEAFAGRPIVVRTLDLGGDKLGAGFTADGVDHGMLGIRGIRLTLRHPEIFARHLQAIIEGFAGSDLHVMFPMIAVPDEFVRAREAIIEAVRSAHAAHTPRLGLMLEIPAAVYALEEFARNGAQFVSFGTNDLAQYFFAANRLTSDQTDYDPSHSRAWRSFLRDAVRRAKAAGLDVGVCGEAAGDAALTDFWVDAGVDKLSVVPGLVPWLKAQLRTRLSNSQKE
jgi:phosphoenolpyruvate-protein kinase (PTS system EI component)